MRFLTAISCLLGRARACVRDKSKKCLYISVENTNCADILNFAISELRMTIATLFRRFRFELFDIVRERDFDTVRGCFLSKVQPDSRLVKVRVFSDESI